MLEKNIQKEKRKKRDTWVGYYSRITPTKKEKMERKMKKHKKGKEEY